MPTIPTCIITDLIIRTEERDCRSRLYWEPTTPPTGTTDMVAIANAVFTNYQGVVPALLSNKCHFQGVYVRYTDPSTDRDAYSTSSAVGGELDSDPLPDETCLEIQRRTGLAGRQNRGRIFLSGCGTELQDDGVLNADGKAALIALAAKIGPDQSFGTLGVCHARHWDRKDNALRGVQQARAVAITVSRRDRRKPLVVTPL
jgi:hypothetical protein